MTVRELSVKNRENRKGYFKFILHLQHSVFIKFNFTMEVNELYLNYTFNTTEDSQGYTVLNLSNYVKRTLENLIFLFELRLPESDYDTKYQRTFFRSKIDITKLTRGVRGNILIDAFYKVIADHIDFEFIAPFRPGYYRFLNLKLPPGLIPFDTKYLIRLNISTDNKKMKKRNWLATVKFDSLLKY